MCNKEKNYKLVEMAMGRPYIWRNDNQCSRKVFDWRQRIGSSPKEPTICLKWQAVVARRQLNINSYEDLYSTEQWAAYGRYDNDDLTSKFHIRVFTYFF